MADQNVDFQVTANTGQAEQAFDKLANSQNKATTATNNFRSAADRSRMVGMSFNRVIQDSPYFLSSFSMGVMSISNNLPIMAEQLAAAKAEALGFGAMLKNMFTGLNGGLLIVNLAISAVLAFAVAQRGSKEETEKATKEIERQAEAMKRMSAVALNDAIFNTEKEVELLKKKSAIEKESFETAKKYAEKAGELGEVGAVPVAHVFRFTKQAELEKHTKTLMAYQAQLAVLGGIENAQNNIKELEEARAKVVGDATNAEAQAKRQIYTDQIDAIKENLNKMTFQSKKAIRQTDDSYKVFESQLTAKEKLIAEYYQSVTYQDETYFQWLTEQWVRTSLEMSAAGLDGEKWMNEQLKKEDEKYFKWLRENNPNWQLRTKIDNYDKPDLLAYDKEDKARVNMYKTALNEFQQVGNNLRSIFGAAGDTFLGKMLEALDVVVSIAQIMESVAAIKAFLAVTTTIATAGATLPSIPFFLGPNSVQPGGGTSAAPIQVVIPVSIGEKQVALVVADGTNKAKRLRYL